MKSALRFAAFLTSAALVLAPAYADNAAQTLPFSQDWSNTGLITANDNWTGVPGIEGFRGDGLTGATGTDPRTILAADDPGVLDVNANQTNPNTFATGGATEFDITDDVVALTGSGTATAPYLRLYLNTTGQSNVTVRYNLRDIDGSADNAAQQVALHLRVGGSGTWTDVPAAYVADASTAGAATLVTPICVVLPAAVNNQALVQLRVMTTNAAGNDEWIGVDDIVVNTAGCGPVLPNLSINDVSLAEGNAGTTNFTFTVSLSAPAGPGGVTFDIATADGTAQDDNPATEDNDYVPQSLTGQTIPAGSSTYAFTVLVNGDVVVEPAETFFVNVTNVTGANVADGQGQATLGNDDSPNLTINNVSLNEGNAGTTSFTFTASLTAPAGAGGVTFDIATADGTAQDDNPVTEDNDYVAQSLTGQTIPAGSSTYAFTVLVNGDSSPEVDETFFVNVTNLVGANPTDTQGQGTIVNEDITFIHDIQGPGAATPIPGATATVVGIVTAGFQAADQLNGFFLQEEDIDADANPATSEGIFVFCNTCPTPVAEGQLVRVTGTVSEFFGKTEITASTAGSVVVQSSGNPLPSPVSIDLPVVGVIDDFYEPREAMRVTFVDTLTVGEYFEMARFGQVELFEGARPRQFTEANAPSVAGYAAHLDNLNRRRVILDDDDNAQNSSTTVPNGFQFIYHPRANGGLSIGTQGVDFFRGGDLVNGLTGVLDWSFAGFTGTDAWRVRPTAANPATFTATNLRPATPPAVGGAIQAAGMNLLNYFTTIDTTASTSTGPCGPSGTLDCRGADSVAELNRQRERASIVICALGAEVIGFGELENTTPTATITDLLGAVNARCGGADPYAFVNTGGTLGTDAIRVALIYRSSTLSPVGAPLSDLDPVHNRPPTAQTFDVIAPSNPAFGERFTVIANHFKSKGCPGTGGDADAGDGQSCFNATRVAQANRLLTWISGTVLPAAGDPDVLLVGDFNANAAEDPIAAILAGGYTDLESALLGPAAYSYVFDGQIGHLDYAFSSASLTPRITGVTAWHINADENPLFDYSDEILDVGEAAFEEKPDGSALVPPRVVFQPATPWRASDHDPVLVGIFQVADLAITKTDSPDPVIAGTNLTYTITVTNNGPDVAANATWTDTLPAGTTFVSQPAVAGWSCTTPPVGSGGTVNCSNPSFAVGSSVFTLTVLVAPSTATGTVLSNTATTDSDAGDGTPANNSATATTTVAASADLSVTKTDTPDPVNAGASITYTITVTNAGPSFAAAASLTDTLPAGTTFVSLPAVAGWSCTTPPVGNGGTVSCTNASFAPGSSVFTLTVAVDAAVANGTVISNSATAGSTTTDPAPGNETGTATTTVVSQADLSVTKTDSPDPVNAGGSIVYTITVTNAGPTAALGASLADTLPAGTTFVSLPAVAGWSCTTPPVGSGGVVSCTNPSFAPGNAVFTLTVAVDPGTANGTVITNSATADSTTTDPAPGNETGTATTTVTASADLSVTKADSPDPVGPGGSIVYTITVTNAGPTAAINAALSDTLPAGTTFVSLSAVAGWSCATPPVGSGGVVSCTNPSFAAGSAVFTLTVQVDAGVAGGTIITNSATATASTPDPAPGGETGTATTSVAAAAVLSATKSVTGDFLPGGAIVYTIVISNTSAFPQPDLAGDELTDLLPPELELVGASATSGTALATVGTNTVTWNGAIAAGGSVTITIDALILDTVTPGVTISNQGTVFFDADGNGSNESSAPTDDPAVGGGSDPTTIVVGNGSSVLEIPTLGDWGLVAFAVYLAGMALLVVRRRRNSLR